MYRTKMDLGEIGWDGVDWVGLLQDRDKWRALESSIKCWGNYRVAIQLVASRVVLNSIELDVYIHVFLISEVVGVVSSTPLPPYRRRNSIRYPLPRRLDELQNRSERRRVNKTLHLPGHDLQSLGPPSHSRSLYRLHIPAPSLWNKSHWNTFLGTLLVSLYNGLIWKDANRKLKKKTE
jgi:hypothetical protein